MLDIEKLETLFSLEGPAKKTFNSLCSTILAKRRTVDYCFEYFKKYKQKKNLELALYYATKEFDFINKEINHNLFNRYVFRCIFYSLVGNNVSRIDNLKEVMLELFPDELSKHTNDPKSFNFKKLCKEFPNKKITSILQAFFDDHHGFTRIQKLRNQMAHSTIDNILMNDPGLDEEHECFINPDFTLSGRKEGVADFAMSLNELLSKIEEQIFNCLITNGKDCFKVSV